MQSGPGVVDQHPTGPFVVDAPPVSLFRWREPEEVLAAWKFVIDEGRLARVVDNPALVSALPLEFEETFQRVGRDEIVAWLMLAGVATAIAQHTHPDADPGVVSLVRLVPSDETLGGRVAIDGVFEVAEETLNAVVRGRPPRPVRDIGAVLIRQTLRIMVEALARLSAGEPALSIERGG